MSNPIPGGVKGGAETVNADGLSLADIRDNQRREAEQEAKTKTAKLDNADATVDIPPSDTLMQYSYRQLAAIEVALEAKLTRDQEHNARAFNIVTGQIEAHKNIAPATYSLRVVLTNSEGEVIQDLESEGVPWQDVFEVVHSLANQVGNSVKAGGKRKLNDLQAERQQLKADQRKIAATYTSYRARLRAALDETYSRESARNAIAADGRKTANVDHGKDDPFSRLDAKRHARDFSNDAEIDPIVRDVAGLN